RPISSMWAESMRQGPAPRPERRAWTEPMTSVSISSAVLAKRLRTKAATAVSVPVADGVSNRFFRYFTWFFFMMLLNGSGRRTRRLPPFLPLRPLALGLRGAKIHLQLLVARRCGGLFALHAHDAPRHGVLPVKLEHLQPRVALVALRSRAGGALELEQTLRPHVRGRRRGVMGYVGVHVRPSCSAWVLRAILPRRGAPKGAGRVASKNRHASETSAPKRRAAGGRNGHGNATGPQRSRRRNEDPSA